MSPGLWQSRALAWCAVLVCCMQLTGCTGFSGLLTGASILYDRHSWYKKMDDFQLRAAASRALYHTPAFKNKLRAVEVAVFNGDVLLAGHVDTPALQQAVYSRFAAERLSYRRLFRYVRVANGEANRALDTWITTQIVSLALFDPQIDPHAFKVITVDQVVYLLGDMFPDQALQLVELARNTPEVLYVVKLLRYYHVTESI